MRQDTLQPLSTADPPVRTGEGPRTCVISWTASELVNGFIFPRCIFSEAVTQPSNIHTAGQNDHHLESVANDSQPW